MKFKDELELYLQGKLDRHPTYKFKVYNYVEEEEGQYESAISDYARETVEKGFLVLLNDYLGDFIPIKNCASSEESCTVYIYLPTEKVKEVLEWLKTVFREAVVADTYMTASDRFIFTMGIPTMAGTRVQNGVDFAVVQFVLSWKKSSKLYFGNSVTMKIDDEVLEVFDGRSCELINQASASQVMGENSGGEVVEQCYHKIPITFHYEATDMHKKIVKNLLLVGSESSSNEVFKVQLLIPGLEDVEITKNMIISTGAINYPLGNFMTVSVVFATAASVLQED